MHLPPGNSSPQVNNCSVMEGGSYLFLGISKYSGKLCTAQGHKPATGPIAQMEPRPLNQKSDSQKNLSLCMRKQTIWVLTTSDTNRAVQSQKKVRSMKFQI